MGRLVTNTPKPVVRVNVKQSNYRGILNLAQTVHNAILANIAIFATPTPTSVLFQTHITSLRTAIASLGTKFNRGSKTQLDTVKQAAFVVFGDLTQSAFYVQTIVDANDSAEFQAVIIASSGFAAKSKKSRVPLNQFVTKARQSNSKKYPVTLRRVDWKKPLGNFSGFRPKSYNIYGMTTGNAAMALITSTTATNYLAPATFTLAGLTVPLHTVIIRPVTATGEGNSFRIPVK